MKFLNLVYESLRFAWEALTSNILRTTLSLLGVTVGIFSIIGVFTMVDSLEANIKESLSSIGDKTVFVSKWPWMFGEGDYPWWEYFKRPEPKYSEFKYLKEKCENCAGVTIMDWDMTNCTRNSSSFRALIHGITYDFSKITDVPIIAGRYFTENEIETGKNVGIIGYEVKQTLFGAESAIGKTFKIKGQKFLCIGVQDKKGKQVLDIGGNPDEKVFIPFLRHKRIFSSGVLTGDIQTLGFESDKNMEKLEGELTGLMRTKRGLKPKEKDNFALNRPDAAAAAISTLFSSIRVGGFIIGLFALLIGGFGIANIMFVSVKERTHIIGIQKSLGAKNFFILFQFLFESIFLCLIGGVLGIFLIYLASFINLGSLDLVLTNSNITFGMTIALTIGIVSGLLPAAQAARMDPVNAIRAN